MSVRTAAEIACVGVVGCGLMGSGIAEVTARAGLDVLVAERDDDAGNAGPRRIRCLERAVARGKLESSARHEAVQPLTWTTELGDLVDREMVIEAVAGGRVGQGGRLFRRLDDIVSSEDAILATNTSSTR